MILQDGEIIGQYRIVGTLGKGGMATVYRATHERLDRDVAIKVMHTAFMDDENFLARFQREARIVAKLDHPNIVPVYDYDEYRHQPYLVMKYVQGPTLKKYALKRGLTLSEATMMMTDLADALDYAHGQGVLHRDMKPSNVMIDQETGRPYITDFGLARIAQAGESTLSHDMMLGTPYYISPEQAQGESDLDHRTDIYAFGVILYELICGSVPFNADTPYAIVHAHIYKEPQSPGERNPDLPVAVDEVILKALAKDPTKRYNSATEMMDAFKAALATRSTPKKPVDAASPDDSDDGDEKSEPIRVQELPDRKPRTIVEHRGKKVEVETSFDMGDWRDLGKRIESGVVTFASMIEDRIDSELEMRGAVLEAPDSPEERIRQRVKKRLKARSELAQHVVIYVMINVMLLAIWFFSSGGAGFPWPLIVMMGWGSGVAAQGMEYYNEYGPGAQNVEEQIQRELEREQRLSQVKQKNDMQKNKNDDGRRLDDLMSGGSPVRLNEDGELTDSFIDEQDDYRRQRR